MILIKQFFIGIILVCLTLTVSAQERVIYGKLTAFSRYPVQNIEVEAKKSKAKVKTDSLGIFALICMDKDVVKINSKVFKSVSRKVGKDTDSLTINLIFVDSEKNREMATGYGYINEADLGYAMSHLQQENNDFASYSDIFELIRGQFPGVSVSNDQVVIRGGNSLSLSSEALYVVDGTISSSISWINPSAVKTIDIIKDSQAAFYGSRGANGVVVIELRKGGD